MPRLNTTRRKRCLDHVNISPAGQHLSQRLNVGDPSNRPLRYIRQIRINHGLAVRADTHDRSNRRIVQVIKRLIRTISTHQEQLVDRIQRIRKVQNLITLSAHNQRNRHIVTISLHTRRDHIPPHRNVLNLHTQPLSKLTSHININTSDIPLRSFNRRRRIEGNTNPQHTTIHNLSQPTLKRRLWRRSRGGSRRRGVFRLGTPARYGYQHQYCHDDRERSDMAGLAPAALHDGITPMRRGSGNLTLTSRCGERNWFVTTATRKRSQSSCEIHATYLEPRW